MQSSCGCPLRKFYFCSQATRQHNHLMRRLVKTKEEVKTWGLFVSESIPQCVRHCLASHSFKKKKYIDTVIVHSLYLCRVLFTFFGLVGWFVGVCVCVVVFLWGRGGDYIFGLHFFFFISSAVKNLLFAGPEISSERDEVGSVPPHPHTGTHLPQLCGLPLSNVMHWYRLFGCFFRPFMRWCGLFSCPPCLYELLSW